MQCVSGNKEGAIFHHLRASREFVEHALNSPSSVNDHDTLKFCLEVYSYFELHAKLRLPARDSTAQDVQTVTACLEFLDGNQTSGFLFGCAWDLYKLIPTVSDFRVLQQRELAGENEVGADELYEELVGRLYNWKAPTPNVDSDRDNSGWTTAEISAAMILQNVLIIMLQTLHCPGRDSMTLPTDSLERIIDHTLSLYDRVNGTSVGAVTYWPLMVLGFYSQTAKQRDAVRRIIQDKIEVERKGLPILDRALEVLSWVWEESEQGVIGLECLEVVLMRRDTDICVG